MNIRFHSHLNFVNFSNNIIFEYNMPFKSISQMQVCYNKKDPRWSCDNWLKETEDSLCCLPHKKGPMKCRNKKSGERVVGPIKTGPRGGKFFIISEKTKNGKDCQVKVYVK
jgi:hypothetical protein